MEAWHVVAALLVVAVGAVALMFWDIRTRWLPARALSTELRKERMEKQA
eukprot:COSAG01_NODE_8985_length_2593_cov_3.713312_3_plen_49_part_00